MTTAISRNPFPLVKNQKKSPDTQFKDVRKDYFFLHLLQITNNN